MIKSVWQPNVHSDSGVIGVSSCPLLRKSTTVVDNG
ncbi:YobH family protein [Klebsiella pneumoniae]